MRPSFFDNLGPEDFIQPDPDPVKVEKRNETFPLFSTTNEIIGDYVMRFPKDFTNYGLLSLLLSFSIIPIAS